MLTLRSRNSRGTRPRRSAGSGNGGPMFQPAAPFGQNGTATPETLREIDLTRDEIDLTDRESGSQYARLVPVPPVQRSNTSVKSPTQLQLAERDTVSVVIPALNEQRNIEWVLGRLPAFVDEAILVDGYSTDQTVAVARAVRPDIVVVHQNVTGKGSAMRTGFAAATCDIIVMIDADGSMDPREIERFIVPLHNGYDFVKGSRFLPDGGSEDLTFLRRTGNDVLAHLANSMFLVHFSDLCYGFCAFRREHLPALALTSHGFEVETELAVHAVKAALRIAEVPSVELTRRNGESNLRTFRDGTRVLRTLLRERVSKRVRPVVDPIDDRALARWTHLRQQALAEAGGEPSR